MRILHTGDWHVGKRLRGLSRSSEHRAVLAEITELASAEHCDVVLVAGDLFETAAPGPEAEAIVYEALLRLSEVAPVCVVAGNHDNPRRLQAVAPLLALGRVHLLTQPTRPDEGGVARVETPGGNARIAMLPFVSQSGIVRAEDLMSTAASTHSPKYAQRMRALLAALTDGFASAASDTVDVVLAHCLVDGGTLGGGERSAHTIFDYAVPTSAFPLSAHYVALGHLHRAQSLPGPCPIRYAGSPLMLDFGETGDTKSVTLVEAEPGEPAAARTVPLRSGRRLRTISGSLDALRERLGETGDDYLRVRVTDANRAGLARDVREWFPHAVDVIVEPPEAPGRRDGPAERARNATPHELFSLFLAERGVDDPRVLDAFDRLLDARANPTGEAVSA